MIASLKIKNVKHDCATVKNHTSDMMSPRRQTQLRPCVDGQQDKTCKQLLGGNTRNNKPQTMTHTPASPSGVPASPEHIVDMHRAFWGSWSCGVCVHVCVCAKPREHSRTAVKTENLPWGAKGGGSVIREGRNY